jgi:hypothetical protein
VVLHSAFGLVVQADRPIPGLPALSAATSPDVCVWLATPPPDERGLLDRLFAVPPWHVSADVTPEGSPLLTVWKHAGEGCWLLRYCDGVQFLLDRLGRNVWVSRPSTSTVADAVTYLLGPVFGLILRLRGALCLHASAIAWRGRAFVLLGPAGAGKSTTAAAFAARGCPVLSDDISVLWDSRPPFLVSPGYPQLRLWPASVQMLFGAADALPPLTPNWDKCGLDLTTTHHFQETSLPLAVVYLLDARRADGPRLSDVSAAEGLFALAQNTYVNYLLDAPMRAAEFAALGRLTASLPLKGAVPHDDPARLSAFVDMLLNDFQRIVPDDADTARR